MSKIKNPSPVEIKAGNELLAKYIGLKLESSSRFDWARWVIDSDVISPATANFIYSQMEDETWYVNELKFHESVDWALHAAKKVTDSGYTIKAQLDDQGAHFNIIEERSQSSTMAIGHHQEPVIALWKAIVKFVELQNQKS